MGRKVFLSFLGTGNYLPTYYESNGVKTSEPHRFIQESLVEHYCKDWTRKDRVIIFHTKDALEKNWEDNGHSNGDNPIPLEGLRTRLGKLKSKGYQFTFQGISTQTGFNEKEIWSIFETVLGELIEGDEVYFDITHSFRSIPMLGTVLLSYASNFDNVTVKEIAYGAFEALGPIREVANKPIEERIAPIVSLNSLMHLQDWINATREFQKFGSSDGMAVLGHKMNNANTIKLSAQLLQLHNLFTTVRGKELVSGKIFAETAETLRQIREDAPIPILSRVIEILEKKVQFFTDKEGIHNGLAGVQYCLDHQLYQQGITLLQEVIADTILRVTGSEQTLKMRESAKSALNYCARDAYKREKFKTRDNIDLEAFESFKEIEFVHKLAKPYEQLTFYRNDINHGGFERDTKPDEFKKILKDSLNAVLSAF